LSAGVLVRRAQIVFGLFDEQAGGRDECRLFFVSAF
jgi:hypothetical protein